MLSPPWQLERLLLSVLAVSLARWGHLNRHHSHCLGLACVGACYGLVMSGRVACSGYLRADRGEEAGGEEGMEGKREGA